MTVEKDKLIEVPVHIEKLVEKIVEREQAVAVPTIKEVLFT